MPEYLKCSDGYQALQHVKISTEWSSEWIIVVKMSSSIKNFDPRISVVWNFVSHKVERYVALNGDIYNISLLVNLDYTHQNNVTVLFATKRPWPYAARVADIDHHPKWIYLGGAETKTKSPVAGLFILIWNTRSSFTSNLLFGNLLQCVNCNDLRSFCHSCSLIVCCSCHILFADAWVVLLRSP